MANNFLMGGGNSAAAQIRSQLALSAAQRIAGLDANRFQQSEPQEQIQRPSFLDFAPEIAGSAASAMAQRNIENEQAQRQQEELTREQEQVARALAERYNLPFDRALQMAQLPEPRLKEAIASLDRERQEKVSEARDTLKFERQKELAGNAFERNKELTQFKADLKGASGVPAKEKRLYEQGINVVKALEKFKDTKFGSAWGSLGGLVNRPDEDKIRPLITKIAGLEGKLFGMTDKQKTSVIDSYLREFYDSPESRDQLYVKLVNDMNPENLAYISGGIAELNRPKEEEGLPQQQNELPQESNEPSRLGKTAALLAGGAAKTLGGPGSLAAAIPQREYKGEGSMKGLPADYVGNLENIDPELRQQIDQQRAQENGEQVGQKAETGLPTIEGLNSEVAKLFPDGYTKPENLGESVTEEIGMDIPAIAAGFAVGGPIGAAIALAQSGVGAAGANILKENGFGPAAQFTWRVASSMGTKGLIGATKRWLKGDGFITGASDALVKRYDSNYALFDKAGSKIHVNPDLLREANVNLSKQANLFKDPRSLETIERAIMEALPVKHVKGEQAYRPTLAGVGELYKTMGKRLRAEFDPNMKKVLTDVRDAARDTIYSAKDQHPKLISKWSEANNAFRANIELNMIENAFDYSLADLKSKAGSKIRDAMLVSMGFGGIAKATSLAKAGTGVAAVLPILRAAGGLQRQVGLFMKQPAAKEYALSFLDNALTQNLDASTRAMTNFMKGFEDHLRENGEEKLLNQL